MNHEAPGKRSLLARIFQYVLAMFSVLIVVFFVYEMLDKGTSIVKHLRLTTSELGARRSIVLPDFFYQHLPLRRY